MHCPIWFSVLSLALHCHITPWFSLQCPLTLALCQPTFILCSQETFKVFQHHFIVYKIGRGKDSSPYTFSNSMNNNILHFPHFVWVQNFISEPKCCHWPIDWENSYRYVFLNASGVPPRTQAKSGVWGCGLQEEMQKLSWFWDHPHHPWL